MTLVACRACGHQVDTSAEACPGCGATNPGRKLSRQKHDLIVLLTQLIIGTAVSYTHLDVYKRQGGDGGYDLPGGVGRYYRVTSDQADGGFARRD